MFAAPASFTTPIGYHINTLVHAAAGYRFADLVRTGLPIDVTVGLAADLVIGWLA